MNHDFCHQLGLQELREFSNNLLNRVEEFREELKEYGGVHMGHVKVFFEDVDEIKNERCFADLEEE